MELRGPFDGFVEKAVRASTTCLIMADHNRYSIDARAAGRMVLVRSHAERIVVLLGDEVVADIRATSGAIRSSTIPALSAGSDEETGALRTAPVQGLGSAPP